MSTGWKPDLRVFATEEQAAEQCGHLVLQLLANALRTQETATMAISGGHSPKGMFATMARAELDWSNVHIFWVDERCVPPDNDLSNFKLADETLLTPARISKYNIHRVHGEMKPEEAAARYVEDIREFFGLADGALPVFDVIHRGMGPDAHTASLFPGEPLIGDRTGMAASVYSKQAHNYRVTLLPGVLLAAKRTVILAAGPDKAGPLKDVLEGPEDPFRYPCQIATRGLNTAAWFVDRAAVEHM
ncbi:MAG TPA: 6-phosphogluconolactonase [Bryobacteraceae bacterium]|jgi:6-phosphogluconolactonase|nr:6-phosphogluconolactonase [Bryobacteraceae bacterium]